MQVLLSSPIKARHSDFEDGFQLYFAKFIKAYRNKLAHMKNLDYYQAYRTLDCMIMFCETFAICCNELNQKRYELITIIAASLEQKYQVNSGLTDESKAKNMSERVNQVSDTSRLNRVENEKYSEPKSNRVETNQLDSNNRIRLAESNFQNFINQEGKNLGQDEFYSPKLAEKLNSVQEKRDQGPHQHNLKSKVVNTDKSNIHSGNLQEFGTRENNLTNVSKNFKTSDTDFNKMQYREYDNFRSDKNFAEESKLFNEPSNSHFMQENSYVKPKLFSKPDFSFQTNNMKPNFPHNSQATQDHDFRNRKMHEDINKVPVKNVESHTQSKPPMQKAEVLPQTSQGVSSTQNTMRCNQCRQAIGEVFYFQHSTCSQNMCIKCISQVVVKSKKDSCPGCRQKISEDEIDYINAVWKYN